MQSSRRSESEWQGLVSEVRARAACCGGGLISAGAPLSIWRTGAPVSWPHDQEMFTILNFIMSRL